MKCQILFSGEKKERKLSPADFASSILCVHKCLGVGFFAWIEVAEPFVLWKNEKKKKKMWSVCLDFFPRYLVQQFFFILTLVLLNKLRCQATSNFQPVRLLDPDCCYKFAYLMANSADPDQLASSEANLSVSTLFAKHGISGFSRTRVKKNAFNL